MTSNTLVMTIAITNAQTDLVIRAKPIANPVSDKTNLEYYIPDNYKGTVTISIYNIHGMFMDEIVINNHTKGNSSVVYDTSKLSQGVYYCILL